MRHAGPDTKENNTTNTLPHNDDSSLSPFSLTVEHSQFYFFTSVYVHVCTCINLDMLSKASFKKHSYNISESILDKNVLNVSVS